jgi:ankyrin repeat protein
MKLFVDAIQRGEFDIFKETLDSKYPNPWYGEPHNACLLETACHIEKSKQFVETLLDKGADPNIVNSVTDIRLLHSTARSGNFEVLKLLLEKEGTDTILEDQECRKILHWLAGICEGKTGDKEKIDKFLNLLLESNNIRKVNIHTKDIWENTALYIAVERGFRVRAGLLLSKSADVRDFESDSKMLLSASLSIVKECLDDCLQDNGKPNTSKDLQLTLDYQSFVNNFPRITESEFHSHLLAHPVIVNFLAFKM